VFGQTVVEGENTVTGSLDETGSAGSGLTGFSPVLVDAAIEVGSVDNFFTVNLEQFDGPIDLLLHLVKQNELEITAVSLSYVTEQYLSCIERMQEYDLDVAGEYLVIAATLLSIKSSLLLNEPVELLQDEEGNLIDPHDELLRRLREAEVYKVAADFLEGRDLLGVDVFAAPSSSHRAGIPEERFKQHAPMLLGLALRRLMAEVDLEKPQYTVTLEAVSVADRMREVVAILKAASGKRLPFRDLIPDLSSKIQIIGSFIALLELCKRQAICVFQDDSFGAISIGLMVEEVEIVDEEVM
jgi:segregation and condensation protein A